jgi:hypothetical protein
LNGTLGVSLYITSSETTHTIIKITERIRATRAEAINTIIRFDER